MDYVASIDQRALHLLVSHRTDALTSFFAFVTSLGGVKALIIISFLICAWMLFKGKAREAKYFLLVIVGTELSVYVAKALFQRPRPEDGIIEYLEKSFSFPSGHAAASAALFGSIAYYMASNARTKARKAFIVSAGILVVALIGLSRLYLGVHYASDVAGGLLVGGAWLSAGIVLMAIRGKR